MNKQAAPRWLILAAFAAIYLVWGSTYLGIGIAIQSMPPHIMVGVRFLISGAILFAFMRWRGVPMPRRIHWRSALFIGILLLGLGNGNVAWAETMVPTGLAALLAAVVPLWMVLIDWFRPGGTRPRTSVFVGIALGLLGMLLLIGPGALGLENPVNLVGVAILVIGTISWAFGSIYSRQAPLPDSPLMLTAMEMLTGGVFLIGMSIVLGEWQGFSFSQVTTASWLALLYLIFVGSFLGFTAYVFLLQQTTPARLSTYAYVNPIVAVFLGWAILGETITPMTIVASAIILSGVAIITYFNTRPGPQRTEPPPAPTSEQFSPAVPASEPKTAHR